MYSSKHLINSISAGIIIFISGLFVLKYSHIYVGYEAVIVSFYFLSVLLLLKLVNKIKTEKYAALNQNFFYLLFISIVLLSIISIYAVPRIGEINRLTAIQDWLRLFFDEQFPYNSKLTPSSYPALFFMSLPFELLGNLGWLEVIGLAIFLFVSINTAYSAKTELNRVFFLFISPMLYYEFVVRCELFFNVALVILLIHLSLKYLKIEKINITYIAFAIAFGVVLSTRSVVAIIYIIFLLYFFRQNLQKLFVFGTIMIFTFALILMPFVLWDYLAFISNGPFAIQSQLSYIPFGIVVLFLLIAVYTGWSVRDIQEVYFGSGLLIFLIVIISYLIKIFEFGFYTAFFEDKIDLSYLVFTFPLFLLSIKEYKVDRYLGKILDEG